MGGGGAVPRELLARAARAGAGGLERGRVAEELAGGGGERLHVSGRHDAAGLEAAHRLGNAAHVVGDRRHAGAERPQERAALVELGPVGEERERRLAEGAVDLGRRQVAEPPVDLEPACPLTVRFDRFERVARDDEPDAVEPPRCLDRVAEPLVRPDDAEAEERAAVVRAPRLAREDGVRDDAQPLRVDAEFDEGRPAVLAVDDDAVEAAQELPPEVPPARGPARAARRSGRARSGGAPRRPHGRAPPRARGRTAA